MAQVNIYLNFDGTTEEAFNFYKSVFGGEFLMVQRISETPDAAQLPANEQNRIMHIAMQITGGHILMASDILPSMGHKLTQGNNYFISLSPDSEEEAHRLFNGISAGGEIGMPLEKMFWGALFGFFTDKFGIQWMVNFDENQK